MSDLLNCPLCQSENIRLVEAFFDGYSPDCLCMKCGCKADKKAWQNRTQSQLVSVSDVEPINTDSHYQVFIGGEVLWCYLNDYKNIGGHRNYWQTIAGSDDLIMNGTKYIEHKKAAPPKVGE